MFTVSLPPATPSHLCQLLLDTAAGDLPHAPLRLQEVMLSSSAKELLLQRLEPGARRRRRRGGLVSRSLGLAQILTRGSEVAPCLFQAAFQPSQADRKTTLKELNIPCFVLCCIAPKTQKRDISHIHWSC